MGANSTNKTSLIIRYLKGYFTSSTSRLSTGVDYYVKSTMVNNKNVRLFIDDFGGEEPVPLLLPQYCKWANGALFLYDMTNPSTLSTLPECVQIIREQRGNIPIVLVGTKRHLAQYRVITREEGIRIAEWYNFSSYVEVSSKTGVNVECPFEAMVELIVNNLSNRDSTFNPQTRDGNNPLTEILQRAPSIIPPEINPKPLEFKINEKLVLKLEDGRTNIYVNGIAFTYCKYLLLKAPLNKIEEYDNIDSIDEAAETLNSSLEARTSSFTIPPHVEFWGHCSNLQAWYEHNYDTRILHSNLAFHLLRRLSDAYDPLATKVFKEEIAKRLETGYPSVVYYIIENKFIYQFTEQELDTILESPKFIKNLKRWLFNTNVPEWLFHRIRNKLIEMINNKSIQLEDPSLKKLFQNLYILQIFKKNLQNENYT